MTERARARELERGRCKRRNIVASENYDEFLRSFVREMLTTLTLVGRYFCRLNEILERH
jgi:hypothetical protein